MAEANDSKTHWLQKLSWLVGILVGLTAIATYFGFKFGQDKQAEDARIYISNVVEAIPSDQRQTVQPIINALQSAVNSAVAGRSAPSDVSRTADELTRAVTVIPTELFSSRGQRVFSVPIMQAAIVCNDQNHISYTGNTGHLADAAIIFLDGKRLEAPPGSAIPFAGGTATLLKFDHKAAVFDVQCGTPSNPP